MIPAVLGMLIIRKPGAALFCETVAATGELIMGSQYGASVLFSGFVQGLGAEIMFALVLYKKFSVPALYRKFNLPVALLAGAACRPVLRPERLVHAVGLEHRLRRTVTSSPTSSSPPSPAPSSPARLSWIATRGLARTGVLSSFASRKAATEPVFS